MLEYLLLTLTGIAAGALGALIGVGGGFIAVPLMILGLGMSPLAVVGTSITMVFFNALSGSLAYWRQQRIDLASGWRFALATFPGAIIGSRLTEFFTGRSFSIAFGILLIILAVTMFGNERFTKHRLNDSAKHAINSCQNRPLLFGWVERAFRDIEGNEYCYRFNEYLGIVLSFGIGFISSAVGIGGGIIHVPLLVLVLKFPPHVATATSLFILTWSALVGSLTHLTLGHFQWSLAIFLSGGGILGAQLGAAFSRRISGDSLVKAFALILVIVGIKMIFD
ncbi:MAG: sulfite exporter TauE/SafE family protein [Syntrophomonadaceae bacterium]|nr:sulfite exporter TauE/SafE family protein [Syntrophomonadaceae bacterium]